MQKDNYHAIQNVVLISDIFNALALVRTLRLRNKESDMYR